MLIGRISRPFFFAGFVAIAAATAGNAYHDSDRDTSSLITAADAFSRTISGAQPCNFEPITIIMNDLVASTPAVDGAAMLLVKHGDVLYEEYFGTYNAETVIPIASATKLLSAATVMTLVDAGLIDLDEPVSAYLPTFQGLKGTMTVRQMFSHTAGLPGDHWVISNPDLTLEEAVNFIGRFVSLEAPPGTQFYYGGVSMHVGGRVAEVVTGQSWDEVFHERIAGPLGMTSADYEAYGKTDNPRIAGGARCSLWDYAALLEMLANGGVYQGQRILSEETVAEMFADQTFGVPIVFSPRGPDMRYGLGAWRDLVDEDGTPVRVSSPGAYGFTPWIDLDLEYYGIFMVKYVWQWILDTIAEVQDLARAEITVCTSNGSPGDLDGDGDVDLDDFTVFADCLSGVGAPVEPGCMSADLDSDHDVDLADFGAFQSVFTGTS